MRDLAVLFLHLLTTIARLAGPGGAWKSMFAASVLDLQANLIIDPPSVATAWARSTVRVISR